MADYTQLMNLEKQQKKQASPSPAQKEASQPVDQPANQLTNQSTSQPTDQPARRSISQPDDTKTVDRPKSFYITLRLDRRLDEAVRYFQEVHGIKKVDRSILVNAILDTDEKWTPETLDTLVQRILRLLTDKLMK
jgi:hypothetical protein